jgi:hypothetical protein
MRTVCLILPIQEVAIYAGMWWGILDDEIQSLIPASPLQMQVHNSVLPLGCTAKIVFTDNLFVEFLNILKTRYLISYLRTISELMR